MKAIITKEYQLCSSPCGQNLKKKDKKKLKSKTEILETFIFHKQ